MGKKTLVCLNHFSSDAWMADWLDKRAERLGIGKAALLRAIVRMCMDKWPEEGCDSSAPVKEEDLYGRISFSPDSEMFNRLSDLAKQLSLKKPGRGVALVDPVDVLGGGGE